MPAALWVWLKTPSAEARIAQCLFDMSHIVQECAWILEATGCDNSIGVYALRREGDAKRQRINQLLADSLPLYSADTRDFEYLCDALDEVIDAMHRVVHHVRLYRSAGHLGRLPREAEVMLKFIVRMGRRLANLCDMLHPRYRDFGEAQHLHTLLSQDQQRIACISGKVRKFLLETYPTPTHLYEALRDLYIRLEEVSNRMQLVGTLALSTVARR